MLLLQSENGYKLWTMQGVLLATVPLESCFQVMWRPRPQSLITKEKEKEILSGLKDKYWRQFEAEDEKVLAVNRKGAKAERAALKAEWLAYRSKCDGGVFALMH